MDDDSMDMISNVALAVDPDIDYVEVESDDPHTSWQRKEFLIYSKKVHTRLLIDLKVMISEGEEYERLFDFVPVDKKAFYVIKEILLQPVMVQELCILHRHLVKMIIRPVKI